MWLCFHRHVCAEVGQSWVLFSKFVCLYPQFLPEQEWEHQGRNWAGLLLVEVRPLLEGLTSAREGGPSERGQY